MYTEAKYTSDNGVPMMRHMSFEFPDDPNAYDQTFQYMLGGSLLVAPIVNQGEVDKDIYLPDTEWIDFWWGAQRPGARTISYYAPVDTIPVFVKSGSIIPMNLNSSYEIGGSIGNDLGSYNNITFRVYPDGNTTYDWYDYVNSVTRTISASEKFKENKIEITIPQIDITSTLQVFASKPSSVEVDAVALTEYSSFAAFQSANTGWYYDSEKLLAYIKLDPGSERTVIIDGVNKAPYEAEFAVHNNVAVDTDHIDYMGTGFVDQFETQGDSVEFDIYAKTEGLYKVDIRYSAGATNASRAIYVNNTKVTNVEMPKTADWDTWNTVSVNLLLNKGINRVKISFDQGNSGAINLDNLVLYANQYSDSLGNVISSDVNGDTITLTIDNGDNPGDDILVLKVCEDNIIMVNYRPNGIEPSDDTPILDPNKTWDPVGATIDTSGDPIVITTGKMRIEISKNPCRLTAKKPDGTILFWEPSSGGVYYNGIRFVRNSGHNLYGIRSYDFLEGSGDMLRNDTAHQIHAGYQGDGGAPLIWSTSGYGILFDTDGGYAYTDSISNKMEMYYGNFEKRRYNKIDVEYYIIFGDPKEIMNGVSEISGKAPMLPKWSMGFMNFEWDIDQSELIDIVDTYRAKNIPIDAYAFDYDWKNWGESNYGEFTWNTTNFPDASSTALKQIMDNKGIRMIGIMKPRIIVKTEDGTTTTQAADAETNGYWYPYGSEYGDYFGDRLVRDLDFYNSDMRNWYWNNLKDAFDKGLVGFWNDEAGKTSAPPYDFWFGPFQGLHMQQAIYEGQRSYSAKRVWSTNRNFYLGAQRYGYTTWSGDIGTYFSNSLSDAGMQEQRERMLSMINLGQAKWGMDTGGFNPWSTDPSPELYTRWMQFSAFTPVFRVHANRYHQRQPWYYGSTAEEVSKFTIHLRNKLMPYIYSYERSAFESGVGLVRPLLFDYPSDNNVSNYLLAWMFGDWMLVAPVLEQGSTLKEIYLPEGTWIDYFRGDVYFGGQTIKYPVEAETWTDIPLFVKKGAIIPSQKALDYIGQSDITTVFVDVFPDVIQTSFTYYDDDGETYDYENGVYMKQKMTVQDNGANGIRFNIEAKTGSYNSPLQYYIVQVHNKAGTNVKLNDSNLTYYADLNALKAASGEGWTIGRDIYGEVTYIKLAAASLSDKEVIITGDTSSGATSYKYEAEEASLSGKTVSTRASINNNHNNYSGFGFVDGYHNAGAATTFYVNVKTGGDYAVSLRYANGTGSTKTLSIFVNGTRIKQTSLPALADWDTWSTQTEILPLTAGNNIIRYEYYEDAGDTGNVNIDYITVPFEPVVAKYEAESAILSGGAAVDRDHWFYSGSGFVDGFETVGSEAEFIVHVPTAGNYKVTLRYANGTMNTGTLSTYVNGIDVDTATLISPGADWNIWSDYEQTLSLNAGKNTIKYRFDLDDSGHVNIDRILISLSTPGTPESEKNLLDNGGFDRPYGYSFNWTEWHPYGQETAYGVDSGSGPNPPESPWTGEKRAYFWLGSAYQQSIHQQISVPNGTYKFEAWVRVFNTTPNIARAEISAYGGSRIDINLPITGTWKYISYENINVTTGVIDIGFYVDSPGGTTVLIDDVRLTKQ
ncbi:MAG TPA: carbohydrate-binding protein [Clostridiaceae bacterium]|nr:carbohydrate-binding protein [Clostridiaceae bacterium]